MSSGVAENPATAVHVQEGGQHAERVDGLDDADPHLTDVRRNGDPFVVHLGMAIGAEWTSSRTFRAPSGLSS
jgi:hypothetical protein